jgi:small subunit ribosomal protein S13
MPRLLGVEIPAKKKVAYSLRYINGIGATRADFLVKEAGLDPDMRAQQDPSPHHRAQMGARG